jgi:histidinol-phosphate/aromatic aminotransferase/cobyric acid decarboxylase-like protein
VEIRALGLEPLPPAGNFLFVPTARAASLARAMRDRGVLVRALAELPRNLAALDASGGQALRIGVGPWNVMDAVLGTLVMDAVLGTLREALACA